MCVREPGKSSHLQAAQACGIVAPHPHGSPGLSLPFIVTVHTQKEKRKKMSERLFFAPPFVLNTPVSRPAFPERPWATDEAAECTAARAGAQAGLKEAQSWPGLISKARELLEFRVTDLISLHKRAGLIIYVDYLSPHCQSWRESSILTL